MGDHGGRELPPYPRKEQTRSLRVENPKTHFDSGPVRGDSVRVDRRDFSRRTTRTGEENSGFSCQRS